MNVSAKTEYACLALLELAARYESGEPVPIRDIVDRNGVPSRFLVQILLQLKGAGLVVSTRGASGGYQLAKRPEEITLADVMSVIDGPPTAPTLSTGRETPMSRALMHAWGEVFEVQHEMLLGVTFADLVERSHGEAQQMYYI